MGAGIVRELPLSAIVNLLVSKGLLSQEESKKISSLAVLQKVLEGGVDHLLVQEERDFVSKVRSMLQEGNFSGIQFLNPPDTLLEFSRCVKLLAGTVHGS